MSVTNDLHTSVEDFLPAVIVWATLDGSARASRVALMASDLLDRSGAAETCLARAMGYTGPLYVGEGNKALGFAEDIVSRAAASLLTDTVDIALVAAGLTAARRIIRASGGLRGHDGCTAALMGNAKNAPRSISERV